MVFNFIVIIGGLYCNSQGMYFFGEVEYTAGGKSHAVIVSSQYQLLRTTIMIFHSVCLGHFLFLSVVPTKTYAYVLLSFVLHAQFAVPPIHIIQLYACL
jgi:hypothetical protein